MIYSLIGKAVVKGGKLFLRRRYGPTYAPKSVLASVVVAAAVGAALAANKQQNAA
jgi:hypothetical protein